MSLAPEVDRLTTVGAHGERNFLHPAEVHGPHTRRRRIVFGVLMAWLLALPFLRIGGAPGMLIDIPRRRMFLLGLSFAPTDSYLLFFLLTGVGFALVVASAMAGRVWCGYACPQTVFLEGVYRRIERLFEGGREKQLRLERGPWSFEKVWRKGAKNALFLLVSAAIAHLFLCYFIPADEFLHDIARGPAAAPTAFAWAMSVTAVVHFNFAWFREQLCIVICPYGRLQSALGDAETIVVGYDVTRGEPRGHLRQSEAVGGGDCIDCGRCVAVCPTGIDIRQGQQLECVGCTGCIDACDEVMVKIGRKKGLIRYDSQKRFTGDQSPRQWRRPRVYLYAGLAVAGMVAFSATALTRKSLQASLLRAQGMPYTIDGDVVRNVFQVRLNNPRSAPQQIHISVSADPSVRVTLPAESLALEPFGRADTALVLEQARSAPPRKFQVTLRSELGQETVLDGKLLMP